MALRLHLTVGLPFREAVASRASVFGAASGFLEQARKPPRIVAHVRHRNRRPRRSRQVQPDRSPPPDFHLIADRIEELKAVVTAAIDERGPQTVAEIRDLLGTTRRFALPLCEWMDGAGIARRNGDRRTRGPQA
ncbi:MAG: hypothetical protein GEU71_08145 [Actinobacteria bacterium]|nr:hypothetical protein [Actinomycetota bacterium]